MLKMRGSSLPPYIAIGSICTVVAVYIYSLLIPARLRVSLWFYSVSLQLLKIVISSMFHCQDPPEVKWEMCRIWDQPWHIKQRVQTLLHQSLESSTSTASSKAPGNALTGFFSGLCLTKGAAFHWCSYTAAKSGLYWFSFSYSVNLNWCRPN